MSKKVSKIASGFVWKDPVAGHVVACGDGTDQDFVVGLLPTEEGANPPDLVLLDPPYGVSNKNRIGSLKNHKDMHLSERWDMFEENEVENWDLIRGLVSVATEIAGGNVFVWSSDYWVSPIKRLLRGRMDRVWPTYHWCKTNPAQSVRKANPTSAVEYLVMSSDAGNHFDISEIGEHQRNWVARGIVHHTERRRRPDGEYYNRAQKPIDLTERLVASSSRPGELVVDLCAGVGTTLIAADRAGRRAIVIEKDPVQVSEIGRFLRDDRKSRGSKKVKKGKG